MRLLFFILLLLLGPALAETPRLRIVQWSDIHDGDRHFLPEAWAEARREGLAQKPDLILLTGDQGDNSYDKPGFAARLKAFMATLGPEIKPLLITLGNDDVEDNYQSDSRHLAETTAIFRATLGDRYYLDDLGNGVFPGRPGGLKWISLNSVIFSAHNRCPEEAEQARKTFAWLEQELKGGEPVVLLCHIPPTWDAWTGKPAWKPEYLARLQQILLADPNPVTIVAGHYHRNHIQGFQRPQGNVPVLVAGSLSNKFGYAPNWRTYDWGPAGIDYEVRYPGHPEWTTGWHVEPDELGDFLERIKADPEAYLKYLTDVHCHHADLPKMAPEFRERILDEFWVHP